jgi:hypothetical protein
MEFYMAVKTDRFIKQKKEMQKDNRVVRAPIGRLGSCAKRGKKSFSPTTMKNAINKYYHFCEKADEVPSIKGMMIHIGMTQDSFYKYLAYPDFTDIMEQARLIIKDWTERDVYSTPGQAAGKIAYMKNLHGWSDKLDTTAQTTVKHITSVGEATKKLEQLAPRLLELLGNTQVANQIAVPEEGEVVGVERKG